MNGPGQLAGSFPPGFISIVKVEFETNENVKCTEKELAPPAPGKKRPKRVLTDEQRKRQAEYKRKWKTRLTDEQRKKNAEYQREYRAKLTEERRQKEAERDRERRANLTVEQRRRKTECDRKRRAFLTEEQRKMRAEYKRKWRARQSDEKRRRIADCRRNRRANLTEEQRIRERERDRERRAKLTQEQRKWKTMCTREWYWNLSEEQRKIYLKRRQIRAQYVRANLTDEQRKKRSEYIRKYNANVTTEQRIRRSEWYRKWYAKLTVEQRKMRVERRRRRLNLIAEQNLLKTEYEQDDISFSINPNTICKHQMKPLNAIVNITKNNYDIQNPLRYLIEQIPTGCYNISLINGLDKIFFRRILQMLSMDYPQDIKYTDKYPKDFILYEIDINCLIELLNKWNGWEKYKNTKCTMENAYEDLYRYLRINLNNIQRARNRIVLNELNRNFERRESVINVTCSLHRLKTLFYHEPHKYIKYYREDVFVSATPYHLMASFPQHIFNWPYISTKINLPNFSMTHQVTNNDEFYLINLNRGSEKRYFKPQTTNLYCDASNKSQRFLSTVVINFLNQLKTAIDNTDDDRREIIGALKEFSKDIALCSSIIDTNTKYYVNLNPYPYSRYLGYPNDGVVNISVPDQKSIKDPDVDIRLRQLCRPKISFVLEKFDPSYEKKNGRINFVFDESFLCKINNCILYKCTLCNEDLGSRSPSREISEHLINHHGFEPDWECTNCGNYFTTNDLSKCRWGHSCHISNKNKLNEIIIKNDHS